MEYPDAELVLGFVYAVGTDYRPVVDYLSNLLRRARYTPREHRLSRYFRDAADSLGIPVDLADENAGEYLRIDTRMRAGNTLREKTGRCDIMALLAINDILLRRPGVESGEPEALSGVAHILVSLKRPEEVETLRKVYGPGFFLIGVFATEQERFEYLEVAKGVERGRAEDLVERDQQEAHNDGQRTRKTFELADVFITLANEQYKKSLKRFVELVFGYPHANRGRDEYGMFMAYCASARSGALARQVGVAILSGRGDVLSCGCNDIPAPGGGLYWDGDKNTVREYSAGEDTNDQQKRLIIESALQAFAANAPAQALQEYPGLQDKVRMAVRSAIADITEFGRSVHAEMDAITSAARRGVRLRGATLYTTTFPCHNCTRHIVAAGIRRVVYIEPYPKSKAGEFHGDAIRIPGDSSTIRKDRRVPFEPFVGIGPRRFFDLFSMKLSTGYSIERKDDSGLAVKWRLETSAKPRVPMAPTSYLEREQLVQGKLNALYKLSEERNGEPTTEQEQ